MPTRLGERYDTVADMANTAGIKAFILPGILLPIVVVYAGQMPDGIIYLVGLEIDSDPSD